jgi:thiol:disulfide interchange protein
MFLASLFFLVPGFQLLQAQSSPDETTLGTPVNYKFPIRKFAEWRKDHRSVLDFRADWCAACLELEERTMPAPKVSSHFESGEWDYVRVDMTQMNDENTQISRTFNVVGLPTVLLTNSHGKICDKLKLFGFENAKNFEARLQRAIKECL